jgi:hypothetical protein
MTANMSPGTFTPGYFTPSNYTTASTPSMAAQSPYSTASTPSYAGHSPYVQASPAWQTPTHLNSPGSNHSSPNPYVQPRRSVSQRSLPQDFHPINIVPPDLNRRSLGSIEDLGATAIDSPFELDRANSGAGPGPFDANGLSFGPSPRRYDSRPQHGAGSFCADKPDAARPYPIYPHAASSSNSQTLKTEAYTEPVTAQLRK